MLKTTLKAQTAVDCPPPQEITCACLSGCFPAQRGSLDGGAAEHPCFTSTSLCSNIQLRVNILVFLQTLLYTSKTWILGWWCSTGPMFYQHLMVLTTGFPGAPPHPRPCTPNVYIPHAPLPTLSLSNLQRNHAPTPPITTCWCCSCSP